LSTGPGIYTTSMTRVLDVTRPSLSPPPCSPPRHPDGSKARLPSVLPGTQMNMRSEESQSNWRDTHSDSQWCKRALLRRTPKDRPSSQEGPGENEQRSCRRDHRDLLAAPANQRKIPLTDGPRQSDGHLGRLDEGSVVPRSTGASPVSAAEAGGAPHCAQILVGDVRMIDTSSRGLVSGIKG